MGLFDFMQEAIAIDLGTANTLIIHNDKVVVDEPSIVAKDVKTTYHYSTCIFTKTQCGDLDLD